MPYKIVLTGAESTGKSTLAKQLAEFYDTVFIEEYARTYVENLKRKYTYNDVIEIAKHQVYQLKKEYTQANKYIFFDTGLIITKIWFEIVFNRIPSFLEKEIINTKPNLVLFMYPDIEWKNDSTRENGGEMRQILSEKYLQQLNYYEFNYKIIKGDYQQRFLNSQKAILALH